MWPVRMPDLRQLRTFVAVAEELNFTRAAARLHLAQQAVSKAVRQLERELGVELLERTTREVRLTAAGAAVLERAPAVLAAADDAFARARAVGHGLAGTIRVGVSPALGQAVRDEVTAVLRANASDVAVSLLELDGERLLTWSAPGTPYTDLLIARLAAAGARIEPVESRVTGSGSLPDLAELDAIAIVPAGWPPREGIVLLAVRDDLALPLMLLWPAGPPPRAAERVRNGMSAADGTAATPG